jgi:hypothetical protein
MAAPLNTCTTIEQRGVVRFFCGQKIWFRHRFPGTCEKVGQVFKFVWRLCWKINVVCMSLSPIDSFQSRFVTYLLNYPRIPDALALNVSHEPEFLN